MSHGILNEVYYPRVDQACIRDLGLIVTDGQGLLFRGKTPRPSAGYPTWPTACRPTAWSILAPTAATGSRRRSSPTPPRDALLQRTRFVPLKGTLADYHLYVLLAPHLGNRGAGNTAWVGDYKGVPMLFA